MWQTATTRFLGAVLLLAGLPFFGWGVCYALMMWGVPGALDAYGLGIGHLILFPLGSFLLVLAALGLIAKRWNWFTYVCVGVGLVSNYFIATRFWHMFGHQILRAVSKPG